MKTPKTLRLLALGAAAAAILAPYAADSGTCANPAARDLFAASWADTMLNGPKGEDTNFFIKAGGVPNIMVLLDTTGSMNRLPPDGPNNYGSALPPGYYVGGNEANSGTQTLAYAANDTTTTAPKFTGTGWTSPATNRRIVGCGIDDVSKNNADFTNSAMYKELDSRRFYPPCGQAVNQALVGAPYAGDATDYAAQMTLCPYFTSSNNQAVGAPGFDPDYYDASDPTKTVQGGSINFFGKSLVFHDNPNMNAGWTRSTTLAFGHNFGDGFYYNGLAPHLDKATGNKSTIASFCKQQGTAAPQMQGTLSHESICTTCLTNKGWYYDGVIFTAGENNAPTPSIWYTGNYLSMFPPKFLIARKVLKDIIAVQSRIRMAMATFANSDATFIQPFNPTCGMPDSSNFDSNRASYVSSLGGLAFSGGTPMSVALFDVGRYYHSPDLAWFGTTWEKTGNSWESAANANQYAVCYSCQSSNAILITDGQPTSGDGDGTQLPSLGLTSADVASSKYAGDASTGIRGITSTVCPECNVFTGTESYKNNLIKVAFYLHNMDLRKNTETTLDCKFNGGKQVLDTYTIGFGTKGIASVNTILSNAAKVGGGMFVPAENTQTLKEGFNAIIEEINGRSTSFSVATVSTLQTVSGSAVHVPRFSPAKTAHWPGHLFRFDLYSEFVNGCTPGTADDYNCDGECTGAFLIDKDGDFISEDTNGAFVKNDPPNQVNCAQAPRCAAAQCAVAGSAPANPYWDGANAWGFVPDDANPWWARRNVYTSVDSTGEGRIDKDDRTFRFSPNSDTDVDLMIPYFGFGGGGVCATLSARFSTAGNTVAANLVTGSQRECAKAIIRYMLGADLFNERSLGATQYPPSTQDGYKDRAFILGDVFHSSPVVVYGPLSRSSPLVTAGLSNKQDEFPLWESNTEGGKEAWDGFVSVYKNRPQIVVVGGNDGMLHAFNDGIFQENKDDPRTPGLDESIFGGYYDTGTGEEVWSFVSPDMLSKLPLFLGTEHQLYDDGSPMVRDVWVDGTGNAGIGGTGDADDVKQATEYHTVVVMGERRGGTRYFALDITDATATGSAPKFLWLYPQPGDKESVLFGETYNDFLPTPPPIGPVRVATGRDYKTNPSSPLYTFDGSNTPFHETWIAFLSGGYDPQYVRGRGLHMVDVWTGKEIFDFSYDPNDAIKKNMRFPFAASVGMVPWGTTDKQVDTPELNGADLYFDTATVGDVGGQMWTLRFHVPGQQAADGRITNWYGARLFQMGGPANCKLCGGQPFFYITANTYTPADKVMRTFAGTGDRINLTDKYGGVCGPANLRACVMRGCTVTVTQASNLLNAPGPGWTQRGMSEIACGDMTNTQLDGSSTSCIIEGHTKIAITGCPSPDPNNGPTATTKETAMSCTELADGYQCAKTTNVPGSQLSLSNTANVPVTGNWYLSLRVFREGGSADPNGRPVFATATDAQSYDTHRNWLTQSNTTRASSSLTMIDSTLLNPPVVATEDSNGWAIYYNHGPTVVVDGQTVNVDWRDERTASGSGLKGSIVTWNSVQTVLSIVDASATGSCRISKCTQEDRRVNYLYAADPITGGPSDLFTDANGNVIRAASSFRLVPGQALQSTTFVNGKGQVQSAMTGVSPESGAVNIGATTPEDPVTEAGSLVLDKDLYMCRHASSPVCK